MQHILEYIIDYGAETYRERPFNEVDFLALSQFSYLKLKDLVPRMGGSGRGIPIRELACHPGSFCMVQENWFGRENWRLLQLMAESERYGDILVGNYAEYYQNKYDTQFQAVTFQWRRDRICVCFRGTDESVAGWKEDFNLAVFPRTSGQEMARTYLRLIAKHTSGKLYVAGHSKGGNLALYAAANVSKAVQERILRVYDYDGPDGGLDPAAYQKIREKVRKYVPQQSFVGMLLDRGIPYRIVKSSGFSLMQHNPYLWWTEHGRLILCRRRTLASRMAAGWCNHWIDSMNRARRSGTIESLFEIIRSLGKESLYHLGDDWKASIYMILTVLLEKLHTKSKIIIRQKRYAENVQIKKDHRWRPGVGIQDTGVPGAIVRLSQAERDDIWLRSHDPAQSAEPPDRARGGGLPDGGSC